MLDENCQDATGTNAETVCDETRPETGYARHARKMMHLGFHPLPIGHGTKYPPVEEWESICDRQPTEAELRAWGRFPGVGLAMGSPIGDDIVVAVDLDVDGNDLDLLLDHCPTSPIEKIGKTGLTRFFRADPSVSTKRYTHFLTDESGAPLLDARGRQRQRRLCDLLAHGTQTVIPPTLHPELGRSYRWVYGPVRADALPILDADAIARLEDGLEQLGYDPARVSTGRRDSAAGEPPEPVDEDDDVSLRNTTWRINDRALRCLESWVPDLGLYKCRPARGGYECVNTMRSSSTGKPDDKRKRNLSINPRGVVDFGTDERWTPIRFVHEFSDLSYDQAFGWLADVTGLTAETNAGVAWDDLLPNFMKKRGREQREEAAARDRAERQGEAPGPSTRSIIRATPYAWPDIATIPRRAWLFGKLAIRGEITLTVAPGGVGKTALGLAEGLAMVTGKPLTGITMEAPSRVWIWNGEEPLDEMHRRIAGLRRHYGLDKTDSGDGLFVDTGDGMKLVLATQTPTLIIHAPVVDALVAELLARQIDVMIVDPFVSTHSVTENDNNAVQEAATAWKTVAQRADCAVMLSHHSRKLNGQTATAESSRGGDALVAKARIVRALNPLSAKEAEEYGVNNYDRLSIFYNDPEGGKPNMTSRDGGREWYKMTSVPLYNLVRGNLDVGDEIGVVTPWTPPVPTFDDLEPGNVETLKARLGERLWYASPQSSGRPDWIGVLIAEVFTVDVNEPAWKDRAKAIFRQLVSDEEVILVDARSPETRRNIKIVRPAPVAGNDNTPSEALDD